MNLFPLLSLLSLALGGIDIQRDKCRWLTAHEWETELKCDGNEVVLGVCSGGGGGGNKDCPENSVHQLLCCAMDDYYYSGCNIYGSNWGQPIDCRDYGHGKVLEGACASGENHDCHGHANLADCCNGHLNGKLVGSTYQCNWEFGGFGTQLSCGRRDEVVAGHCGSGKNRDCPGTTAHGILCCELDYMTNV